MKSIGRYKVYLKGSKSTIERTIWVDINGTAFIKYYGSMIEVERGKYEYITVEDY